MCDDYGEIRDLFDTENYLTTEPVKKDESKHSLSRRMSTEDQVGPPLVKFSNREYLFHAISMEFIMGRNLANSNSS